MKNYYKILNISHSASQVEIKNAFYSLARKYHPDVNKEPNANHVMQEITEAYEVLSNETSRREYDAKLNIYGTSTESKFQYQGYTSHAAESMKNYFDEYLKSREEFAKKIDEYTRQQEEERKINEEILKIYEKLIMDYPSYFEEGDKKKKKRR